MANVPPLVMQMTESEFLDAKRDWGEYSCSMPTGVFPGKRWLRDCAAYQDHLYADPPMYGPRQPPDWYVGEYFEFPEGDPRKYQERRGNRVEMIGTRWYRLLISA